MADQRDGGITWTDQTWSPVRGCSRVSEGCRNCYAERVAARFSGPGQPYEGLATMTSEGPRWTGNVRLVPEHLEDPLRWKRPRRVFVNSMSDLFHESLTDEQIARVWQVMGAASWHVFQVLTKRPERMLDWVSRWTLGQIDEPLITRPVAGYPGYSVSTRGEVFGKRADTITGLSPDVGVSGHCRVTMHRAGSPRSGERALVHRLVLEAFVRAPRDGEQACHRNGDPTDNRLSNLYWGDAEANWRDRVRHGNGRSYSKLKQEDVDEIRRRFASGESASQVANAYSVSDTQIRNIVSGRQWSMPQPAARLPAPARPVLDSVWLGVSVENQKTADERIPQLLKAPAAVRFVSYEPALWPVDLSLYVPPMCGAGWMSPYRPVNFDGSSLLHWVICGGESGPGARPMHPDWARSVRDQCKRAGVAFHFKQWGEYDRDGRKVGKKAAGRELDGRTWDEFPEVAS